MTKNHENTKATEYFFVLVKYLARGKVVCYPHYIITVTRYFYSTNNIHVLFHSLSLYEVLLLYDFILSKTINDSRGFHILYICKKEVVHLKLSKM